MALNKEIITSKIADKYPDLQYETEEFRDELKIKLHKNDILKICRLLKDDKSLNFLLLEDIAGVDWARRRNRFSVVYHIFSLDHNYRLVLKADIDEKDLTIDSVTSVWKTANWHERETYDMFGIVFNNHPDLRRMYMGEDFEYYPLRKEFPVMGIPGSIPLPKK